MYIAKIDFILADAYGPKNEELVEAFLRHFRYLGRIVGRPSFLYKQDDVYSTICRVPEKEALDNADNFFTSNASVSNIIKVKNEILGKDVWSNYICTCEKNSFYIFKGSEGTPLYCGTCGNFVPLYRIPPTYEPDPSYYDIVCWNTENLAWSNIEYLSVHESIAQKQLYSIHSKHNQQAVSICQKISLNTGSSCFYYLEGVEINKNDNCPLCGNMWFLNKTLLKQYKFKCDNCKLIG